jgi:hypothetical protein
MEGSLEKIHGTHVLARHEILYRMMYKTSKKKFLFEFCFAGILIWTQAVLQKLQGLPKL